MYIDMLTFHKTVLGIAIIILILILGLIGYSLSESVSTNWPPIVGDCPDYWVDLSGNGEACYNSHSLGTSSNSVTCGLPNKVNDNKVTVNFSGYSDCDKFNWATSCGVVWDGINSGVLSTCETTTTTEDTA
jgi:hypothetical protein